jgi:four helix bundle protein
LQMTGKIESYRDLLIWQQAMDLVTETYVLTRNWPKDEIYGLTSQVRRASVSVPANIAEGYGRESRASYQNFLRIAQGSLKELETLFQIAVRVGIESEERIRSQMLKCESVGKLIRLLVRKLENSRQPRAPE